MDEIFNAVLVPEKSFLELPSLQGVNPLELLRSFDPRQPIMVYAGKGDDEVGYVLNMTYQATVGLTGELALPEDLIQRVREHRPARITVRFSPKPGVGLAIQSVLIVEEEPDGDES